MRNLVLLASLIAAPSALAADASVAVGAHAGVITFDQLDQLNTSWYVSPRLGVWFKPTIGLELDVGISTGAADVTDHGFLPLTPQLNFAADPLATKDAPVRPLITLGGGLLYKDVDGEGVSGDDYAHQRFEAFGSFGTGLIVPIAGPLAFRTDVRILVSGGPDTALYPDTLVHLTWTGGLELRFAVTKDADKDKVSDKLDLCIDEPEDRDGFEDGDGCPDPDNDGDGIADVDDQCTGEPEDLDGFEDADGCPDADNDGDDVLDVDDECPLEAGLAATDGCPDGDGDGIPDGVDDCPEQTGPLENGGCPDTDGDGLRDPDDECPTEAGPAGSFGCTDADTDRVPDYRDACPDEAVPQGIDPMRSDGCPARVYVTADAIVITEQVFFESGTARIRSGSYGLLNDISVVLRTYPSVEKVRVEGHTDDRGDDASNLALSQSRAQAVVDYLVNETGVEAERLVATGYGETVPVADNRTAAGRATNRRVAFTILEQESVMVEQDAEVAPQATEPAAPEAEVAPAETEAAPQ